MGARAWFAAVVFLLCLSCSPMPGPLPSGGAGPVGQPGGRFAGFHYIHRLFSLELTRAEAIGEEVKVTFRYTNQTASPQYAGIDFNFLDRYRTYLVDNLGNRLPYLTRSFSPDRTPHEFPPRITEEIWITYGNFRPAASSVNLFLAWDVNHGNVRADVVFRGIPLR